MPKLAIRTDRPAGVIRAFHSSLDDSERIEIATLHIRLADAFPDLYRAWLESVKALYAAMVADATGADVVGFDEFRTHHKN